LLEGLPWHQVSARIQKEFGLAMAAPELTAFWQECCLPHLRQRRDRAVALAQALTEDAQRRPGPTGEALLNALQQKAFETAVAPNSKSADLKALFDLVFEARAQQRQDLKLDLDRRKVELLETGHPASPGPARKESLQLTDEERKVILKEIDELFGL
jgi:hypothetical protein